MMTFATRRRSLLSMAAASALAIGPAGAQDQAAPQPPPAEAPATAPAALPGVEPAGTSLPSGEDVAQGVFVRDSAIAVDQFALAERMERLRDWTKAADVYQDVITRFGDRLIADRSDEDGKVYQYASVGRAVQRRLAAWPAEARAIYEQKFGAAARTMLEQAKAASPPDAEQLQKVVRLYFITEAGRDAAMLLLDRQLADGSFAAARRLSRELLEMHPAATEHRPRALLRALIAAHFLGDDALAAEYAQQIAHEFAQSREMIAGEEQSIADVANDVLATTLAGAVDPGAGGWPTFGGSDDRARLAAPLSSQIAPYVQDIRVPESSIGDRPINASFRKDLENDRLIGKLTGIFPVAHDGALFWSDNIHVFAVALDSGLPLPGWLDTYGGGGSDGLAGYTLPGGGFTTPRGTAITPTVTDDFVVANMGLRDERLFSGNGQPAIAPARMVCLERETGRPMWSRTPSELEATLLSDPALQADLGECQFVGAPIAVGQTVWSLAKTDTSRGRPFEQCFLVSLDIETGNTRSITYLTSSSGGDPGARFGQRTTLPEPTSIMAYSDGLIYAPTDTGALAAVRVADGGVEWLNLYPRIPIDPMSRRFGPSRLRLRSQTESQPFHTAPVIVDGGRVFFKPPDARHAFIWNAAEGDEVARIDLTGLDGDRTLLKVLGDRLITFGSQGASCINWQLVSDGQAPADAVQWASRIASKQESAEDSILGRPAVTQTQLFLPTPEHLRVVQLSDGRVVATYPTGGATWAQNEEPGNVIVLQDQLVIAGPSRLNIYADSGVIRERLQQQIADNPDDPVPLLRLAQIGFVTGDFDATVERLRQAEQSATAGAQPEAQGAVFASALGFAQTLAERLGNALAPGSPTPETVDRFFTLAEKFAHSPGQNVRVRFARADFARRQGGPDRGVALLQEILSQPQWRSVPVVPESRDAAAFSGESFTPRQAGEVARELLAEVIAGAGPQVYEPIERRAAAEVADATSAGDVEALQRLSEIYPNSAAAQSALAEAARLLQAQNRPREAASALRRLSARSEDPLAAWLTLAQIEATRPGRLEAAAGRFRRAARVAPEAAAPALSLADGQPLLASTIEQAAFRLTEATLAAQTKSLPDLRLPSDPMQPLFQEDVVAVAGVEALLLPAEGFERYDRVVVRRTDGTLAAYPFAASEPAWAVAIEPSAAESIAWLPQGLLVWGDTAVALLDAQSGAVKWRHMAEALAPPPVSDQRSSERAVVATGWRPQLNEIETSPSQSLAEQQLQLRAMEQGGRGRWRREEQLRNLDRLERIAQQRRANADEQDAQRDTYAVNIAGVVPSAGNIGVILGGTSNSLAGVVADDGQVPWRAPLPDGEVAAACGAGDFVAVQTASSRSLLSVMDLDTGALVTRRGFELAGAEPLVNFLITPENELIYVTRQQLIGVDLERQPQGTRFTVRHDTLGENPLAFGASAGAAGRLRVIGDKLLVLIDPHRASSDQGARRDALVIDLAEGRPETFNDPASGAAVVVILTAAEGGGQDPEADALPPRLRQQQRMRLLQAQREAARLVDQAQAPGERIWSAGTSVYVTSDRGLSAYDLAVPGRHWSRLNAPMMREFDPALNLGLAIGRDDLLLFDQPLPTQRRQIDQPTVRVTAFSRDRLKDGRESGQQRHEVELKAGAFGLEGQVSGFAPGEGGIAVLSSAGRLVFLRGGGDAGNAE